MEKALKAGVLTIDSFYRYNSISYLRTVATYVCIDSHYLSKDNPAQRATVFPPLSCHFSHFHHTLHLCPLKSPNVCMYPQKTHSLYTSLDTICAERK